MIIRYCSCGDVLATNDVKEGVPCKKCRKRKGMKLEPLGKVIKKPNPAKNLWEEMHKEKNG